MNSELVIHIPNHEGTAEAINCGGGSVVIVGANGAGKTRLGTWIELHSPEKERVHRISAQKSLSMPDTSTPTSIELAENALIWGNSEHRNNKAAFKWKQKPATSLLNDFDKLMIYLFSEETEQNAIYKANAKVSPNRVEPPITKLDKVKLVWEKVLPHRELVVGGLRIQTHIKGSSSKYNASEMSDGERVIFYLIGQCLAAPKNGIIVIDEPELHLHKSIQTTLWSEIEKLRRDCIFVYLTHDVNFAAAHEDGAKIWLKSYDGKSWEWEEIEKDQNLPEALLLEVLGSRRPVVFVEGDDGSQDVSLYREILSEYLVIPRGGCDNVVHGTKALRANKQFHHLDVYGIVDRDRKTQPEITALEQHGIYVLDVAEVENLFCCEEVLRLVSDTLSRDQNSDFSTVRSLVIRKLRDEINTQVSLHVSNEVKYRLTLLKETTKGEAAIAESVSLLIDSIDIHALYESYEKELVSAIDNNDYRAALRLYNRKSLCEQVSSVLGLKSGELSALVIRLAKGDKQTEVRYCLKEYFGGFSAKIV